MKIFNYDHFPSGKWRKIIFFMRLKLVVLLCSVGTMAASPSFSQQKKFDVSYNRVPLTSVLNDLKTKTGYQFVYFKGEVPENLTISIAATDATVEQLLDEVLVKNGFAYDIKGEVVIISRTEITVTQQPAVTVITGTVRNPDGTPIAGATAIIKGTQVGAISDVTGSFSLRTTNPSGAVIVFSFLGKKTVEVAYTGQQNITVTLEDDAASIDEVVVTGIFDRPKESFTGAVTHIKTEGLLMSSSQSLVKSISNIDPAFRLSQSNIFGSDPNKLAQMEVTMRGHTTLADYQSDYENAVQGNLPLFVIDRFISDIQTFLALDESRVASVTLLKDASATALYGSRASNGVVVVTTKKPPVGKLRVIYRGQVTFNAPDLSTYDLMNAREKVEYELAAGLYDFPGNENIAHTEMSKYYAKKLEVERGVDTHWLHYPVRLGVSNSQSLTVEGGENSIRYSLNINNNNNQGVMKGSYTNTLSGNMFLQYEVKNLVFSNRLTVSNYYGKNSKYGSFERYTKMNAYWQPYDEDGNPIKVLDDYTYASLGDRENAPGASTNTRPNSYNPLWNASLPYIDDNRYTQVTNNFEAIWNITNEVKAEASFSFTTQNNRADLYKSPDHTDFENYSGDDINRKGSYYMKWGSKSAYEGSLSLVYRKVYDDRHSLNAGISGNVRSDKSEWYSLLAEGLSVPKIDFLPTANQYEKDGRPKGSESLSRNLAARAFANYTYDSRYYIDLSGTVEGSSKFGANKRTAPFGSVGLGWNIHNEAFLKDGLALNTARIRMSYGYTGSVNFSAYDSQRMYELYADANYKGLFGMTLMGLGNPDLGWQVTNEYNVGVDLGFFGDRVTLNVDAFNKVTNDLITSVNIPSSSGFKTYVANIGKVSNKGLEAALKVRIIDNKERNIQWTVGGSAMMLRNKILKIGEDLEVYNSNKTSGEGLTSAEKKAMQRNSAFLFREGESLQTLFAVKSKGIDPATGKEIFVKLDGTETFDWNSDDYVACGTKEPTMWGNVSTDLRYKGFILQLNFYYTFGGHIYNGTLASKIENTYPYMNLDRRAYAERWREPGDVALYKSVKDLTTTNATSRFVMKENTFRLNNIALRYQVPAEWSHKHLGLSRVELQGNIEDVFYISTIKRERGTDYPFARTFSFNVNITF